jgi:hypothetical protein
MVFTRCLNIPSPTAWENISSKNHSSSFNNRFQFVSDNQLIHQAGNTLQITKLPTFGSKKESRDQIFSQLIGSRNDDVDIPGPIFAEAEIGRGFACLCLNYHRRLVAYSPRSINPSIIVKTLQEQNILCKIDNGVKLEYADTCFNREGTKLAAVGKDEIDAVLLVWSIEPKQISRVERIKSGKDFPYNAVLIARYILKQSVAKCHFNPTNDNMISLVYSNGTSVSICQLVKFIDQWKVEERMYNLTGNNDNGEKITMVAWDNHNQVLLGTSSGSTHILEVPAHGIKTVLSSDAMKGYGAVNNIVVSDSLIIVAFQQGKIVFVRRQEQAVTENKISIEREVLIHDEIMEIASNPSFEFVLVLTRSSDLFTCLIEDSPNSGSATFLANIQSCIISSLAPLVMTGKASVTLLLLGGSDGKVKVMKDIYQSKESCSLQSTIACLDIGSPITAIETFQGYPICAVGSADGCLNFVYISRRKEGANNVNGANSSTIAVDMIVLKSEILSSTPITSLAFSTKMKKVIAGCYMSGQAFVICAEPTNLHVMGVVETTDKSPLCVSCWSTQYPAHILTGSQSGKICCFDTTTMCFSPDPLVPLWECSLGLPVQVQGMAMFDGKNGSTTVHVSHPGVKGFETYDVTFQSNQAKAKKYFTQDCFPKHCCCLIKMNRMLIAGSVSGDVAMYESDHANRLKLRIKKSVHFGSCLAATLSSDKSRLYSSSVDGTLFAHSIGDSGPILQSAYEYDYLVCSSSCSSPSNSSKN